jgi:hypothetical protein
VELGVQPRDGEVVADGAFESGGGRALGPPLAAPASAAPARSPSRCQNSIGSKPTATTTQYSFLILFMWGVVSEDRCCVFGVGIGDEDTGAA